MTDFRPRNMRATLAAFAGLAAAIASAAASELPPSFVRLSDLAPDIRQDMRYAGPDNFVGRPIAGYGAADCWLRRDAAEALAKVGRDLAASGWRLVVYDCYRPQRAVDDFARWAEDASDQKEKAEHYPAVDKRQLFALGYIARVSGHSKGAAVDVGAEMADGAPVDFGTAFDAFDPKSATASRAVSSDAHANRERLVAAFAREGFQNLAGEWWHFSLRSAADAKPYDLPITPR